MDQREIAGHDRGAAAPAMAQHWPWPGAAMLALGGEALVMWRFQPWNAWLVAWQLDQFGWYLPTALPVLLLPVAVVALLLVPSRHSPADDVHMVAAGLAMRLGIAAIVAVIVALVLGITGWPSGAVAAPARLSLRAVEARGPGATGPVILTDGRPGDRVEILDLAVSGFGSRTALVMLRHGDGSPSTVFAAVPADAEGRFAPFGGRGFVAPSGLPAPVLAGLSATGVAAPGTIAAPPIVLFPDAYTASAGQRVAALQALVIALILAIPAAAMAWRARTLADRRAIA